MPQGEHADPARRERFERLFNDVYGPLQRYVRRRSAHRRDALTTRVAGVAAAGDADTTEPDPDLTAALGELSADDREIVRLWAWEQLEPREIAVVLAITPNEASVRLHRAKRRLAARFGAGKEAEPAGHNPVGGHTGQREEGA